ncbi:MAG TPA: hypothetical protein VMW10_12230 [Alphaproteobacteria bacterium]|nr:hypothetical protein [Alphaproteobacteria bacterium]
MEENKKESFQTLPSRVEADIKKIGEDLYQVKRGPSLFFVMEPIIGSFTDKALQWIEYVGHGIKNLPTDQRQLLSNSKDAYERFEECLESKSKYGTEVWVVHALDQDYRNLKKEYEDSAWEKHLEMSFCSLAFPKDPFQMHMGITRNPLYEGEPHRNLSVGLHSFAAEVINKKYNNKMYMVTKPLYSMKSILIENLPSGSYQEQSQFVSFSLKNEEGEKIFWINPTDEKYKWFSSIDADPFIVDLNTLAGVVEWRHPSENP